MFKFFFCIFFSFGISAVVPVSAQNHKDTDEPAHNVTDITPLPEADSAYTFQDSERVVAPRQVRAFAGNPDYAYANDPAYWKENSPAAPRKTFHFFNIRAVRWTIFLAVIFLIGYGIFQLTRESQFKWLFQRSQKREKGPSPEMSETEIDFDQEIRRYQTSGNFRMAIRYMYLQVIQSVRESQLIQIRDSATNADIVRAFGNSVRAAEFRHLATVYEYTFYGGYHPDSLTYDKIKSSFIHFQQNISG